MSALLCTQARTDGVRSGRRTLLKVERSLRAVAEYPVIPGRGENVGSRDSDRPAGGGRADRLDGPAWGDIALFSADI